MPLWGKDGSEELALDYMEQFTTQNPFTLTFLLASLALLPFFIVMGTSFVKLSIVFSLLRNALGIQQIPPNMALHGLCLILTIYIMAPVGFASYEAVKGMQFSFSSRWMLCQSLKKLLYPTSTSSINKHQKT